MTLEHHDAVELREPTPSPDRYSALQAQLMEQNARYRMALEAVVIASTPGSTTYKTALGALRGQEDG